MRAAAAGAGGVEQILAGRRNERGEGAHRPRQPGELLDRLPLHAQRDQEAGDLDVGGLAGHDLGQRLGGVTLAEVAAVGEAIDRAGQQLAQRCALHEAPEHLLAVLGQDRLGVELNALGRKLAVANGHHDTAAGGADLEHVGQLVDGDQRVVAADLEVLRQPAEDRAPVVLDPRGLAVDRLVADHLAAPRLDQRLVPEADAERRDAGQGEAFDRLETDARLVRRAWARRDDHAVIAADQQILDARVVVAHHLDLVRGRLELTQVLDEVVGEAVVVVDDEDAHVARRNGGLSGSCSSRLMKDKAQMAVGGLPLENGGAPCLRRPPRLSSSAAQAAITPAPVPDSCSRASAISHRRRRSASGAAWSRR